MARQPAARSVQAGEAVTISATCASGYDFNGPVSFQWRRNGVPITDGPGGASSGGGTVSGASGSLPSPTTDPTATLRITNAQPGDAGAYTVVFSNTCGSTTSIAAAVTITTPCSVDLNGDGAVDFNDYLQFLNLYNANDLRADFNGDGAIDFNDYVEFLSLFNAGC